MARIGATATAEDVEPGQLRPDCLVLAAEFRRVGVIEGRGLVEFRVALARGVAADAADAPNPVPVLENARAWRACTLGQSWFHGYCDDRDATQKQVAQELQTALMLDDNDGDVHRVLAALNLVYGNHDKATYHQERALSLNPNDDLIVVQQGEVLTWLGRPEEGIEWIKQAMRLNPYHPERFWNHLGRAYYVARRYAEAIEAFKHISEPDHTHHACLAASYAQMGDDGTAQIHAREVRKREPEFSVESYLATLHYKHDGDREHHREGLLKAGLAA